VDQVVSRISQAFEMMMELYPFLLYRLSVYGAFAGIMLVYWLIALGLCTIAYNLWETLGTILFLICIAGNYGIITLGRSYFLYMVKAGYVAVLTRIMTHGTLPPGKSQTDYAKDAVQKRFKEANAMVIMDQLVKGVVRAFNGTLEEISSWIPIPGISQLVGAVQAVVRVAANTIDEAILSLTFSREDQNIWDAAKDGLILYVQNWKPILWVATAVVLLDWLITVVLFVMLMVIVGVPSWVIIPTKWSIIRALAGIIPFLITYVIRLGIIEPLGMTAVLITFQHAIKGQKVDPSWDSKLEAISGQFRELKQRAAKA
jgi:hypothetical protein